MILFSVVLTLLVTVVTYLSIRVNVLKGYKEQFVGIDEVYDRYVTYLLSSMGAIVVVALIGYLYLFN